MPNTPDNLQREAVERYQAGDRDAAARLCRAALEKQPHRADSIYLLAVIAADSQQPRDAIAGFTEACQLEPRSAIYANALGEALFTEGRVDEAIEQFRRTAQLKPDYERAHYNLGRAFLRTNKPDDAIPCFLEAIRLNPGNANALNNIGGHMLAKERLGDALDYFRRAAAARGDFPEAHYNCASVLLKLDRPYEAISHLRHAILLRPQYGRAHLLLGQTFIGLNIIAEAIAPLRAAIELPPHVTAAYCELGQALLLLGRLSEAREAFAEALRHNPDDATTFASRFRLKEMFCDWRDRHAEIERLWADARHEAAAGRTTPTNPICAASLPWTRQQQRFIAENHAMALARTAKPLPPPASPAAASRIKVGYFSGDLRDHPVGHQVQDIFALHERGRFEVHAYSFGPNDGSSYRQRIAEGAEHFHDVAMLSTTQLAQRIREDGIHLLVDLMGFSGYTRMGVLAMRPAPVQINWLGFPGTMGAPFIDYIIGDPIITPAENADGFSEAIVRLPHTYMPTAHRQPISSPPRRADQGLPEDAIVFCCFNLPAKLEPRIFDVWMRILRRVEKSVAWLNTLDPEARANLRQEAEARGVEGGRLIFAERTPSKADHLARHALADLFLDTHFYNAHVTACDALWAGLPVISCPGDTFPSRVGASLVRAAGLPELVVDDLEGFESVAVRLAHSPDELRGLRQKLVAQRDTCPLFDTPRFVRNLELAYGAIWANAVSGRPPTAIDVSRIHATTLEQSPNAPHNAPRR